MGFKENVETLLSRSHWSQRKLAAAAGISPRRVSQILANPTLPTLAAMTKIADAFGLDVADMLRDERFPAPPAMSLNWPCAIRETSIPTILRQSMPFSRISATHVRRGTSMASEKSMPPARLTNRGINWRIQTACP